MEGMGTGHEIPVFTGMTGSNTVGVYRLRNSSYVNSEKYCFGHNCTRRSPIPGANSPCRNNGSKKW